MIMCVCIHIYIYIYIYMDANTISTFNSNDMSDPYATLLFKPTPRCA